MYAVIESGGKQYLVREGEEVLVEKLAVEADKPVSITNVLFVGGDKHAVGTPTVKGATVKCKVVAQEKGPKIVIFKMRKRKNSKRKTGHRQEMTRLFVEKIDF
jgi:large subunit ribosomal protein L21